MKIAREERSQNIIMWLCWAVYTFAYMGRYSYNANINLIIEDYNVSYAEAGLVVTFFFFAYGIGQVLNGMLTKRYNKKILFPLALLISSVFNLLVFFGVPFRFIKYLWMLNGVVQSCFWPALISVIGEKLEGKTLNKAITLTSTSSVCGTVLVYGTSALFVKLGLYKLAFLFGALAMLLVALLWMIFYQPSPSPKEALEETETKKTKPSFSSVSLVMGVLAFFAIVDNLAKDGLTTWLPSILKESYNMKDEMAILLTIFLPFFGIAGTLLSVKVYNKLKNLVSEAVLFFLGSALLIGIFAFFGAFNVVILLVVFGVALCLLHAVNSVVTAIAPLEIRSSMDSGKIAGVLNGFCYLGSTISSYGLGFIADNGGWKNVFLLLFSATAAATLLGVIYLFVKKKREE